MSRAGIAWSFPALMRIFLTGWIVLCVLAGLNVRLLAAGADHAICCQAAATPCEGDHSACPPGEHPHEKDGCPGGEHHHHHHACCSHLPPVVAEEMESGALVDPDTTLLGIRPQCEIAPDGPFLGSEKPPLI